MYEAEDAEISTKKAAHVAGTWLFRLMLLLNGMLFQLLSLTCLDRIDTVVPSGGTRITEFPEPIPPPLPSLGPPEAGKSGLVLLKFFGEEFEVKHGRKTSDRRELGPIRWRRLG